MFWPGGFRSVDFIHIRRRISGYYADDTTSTLLCVHSPRSRPTVRGLKTAWYNFLDLGVFVQSSQLFFFPLFHFGFIFRFASCGRATSLRQRLTALCLHPQVGILCLCRTPVGLPREALRGQIDHPRRGCSCLLNGTGTLCRSIFTCVRPRARSGGCRRRWR